MYYNIIPLILILIAALVIIRIIIKKFPAVVNLDVASLPQEKERQAKQRIINTRFKRSLNKWLAWVTRLSLPVIEILKARFQEMWQRLLSARENLARGQAESAAGTTDMEELFFQAEEARKNEDYSAAEKYYIRLISLDSKNIAAFKSLGQLYLDEGKHNEARETLEHVLKLTQEDADVYAQLADVAAGEKDVDKARQYYQQALQLNNQNAQTHFHLAELNETVGNYKEALKEVKAALRIEPKNPRYLDGLFSVSILMENKAEALDAYKMLKAINPENAKLEEMKEQIDEI